MKKAFIVFGIKPIPNQPTSSVEVPKFKLAVVESGVDNNAPIPLTSVLFSGCEDTAPEHVAALLIRAEAFIKEKNLEIAYAINGHYVSQSTKMITAVDPVDDKRLRHLLDEHFGIFHDVPELDFIPEFAQSN